MMQPWQKLPLSKMWEAADREFSARRTYRPQYVWFRSFGGQPGSLMRFLLLATLSDESTCPDDILHYNSGDDTFEGLYVESQPLAGKGYSLVDPMMGTGTTVIEGARLGINSRGYDNNPVAWWVAEQTVRSVDHSVEDILDQYIEQIRSEVDELFSVDDDETVLAYLRAVEVDCPVCETSVELHSDYIISEKRPDAQSRVVLCPRTECQNRVFVSESDPSRCPTCGKQFDPREGNIENGIFTCQCDYKTNLINYLNEREQKPEYSRYAVYFERDGQRGFRDYTKRDEDLVDNVKNKHEDEIESLPVPTAQIKSGDSTQHLLDVNLSTYRDLFTPRQQLALGALLDSVQDIESEMERELVTTLVVSTAEYCNLLTRWNKQRESIESPFFGPESSLPVETVEVNPLTDIYAGSLQDVFRKYQRARSFLQSPIEPLDLPGDSQSPGIEIEADEFDPGYVTDIDVGTADRLDAETGTADCVVLDPPFYDAVQFSEFFDFFYVWLREALGSDSYEAFRTTHIPRLREVSINKTYSKDRDYYHKSLRNIYEESFRILSEDGTLILLSQYSSTAWPATISLLVKSGFRIDGAIPLHDPVSGDEDQTLVGVFASKTSRSGTLQKSTFRQNVLYDLESIIDAEEDPNEALFETTSTGLRILLEARGLTEYSEYYPNVYADDTVVEPEEALGIVRRAIAASTSVDQTSRL